MLQCSSWGRQCSVYHRKFLLSPGTVLYGGQTPHMSHRPNHRGFRRGGSIISRNGSRRGGIGRGGGEQRWWDPVWRSQRLREKQAELEDLDQKEWWSKMELFKATGDEEKVMKHAYRKEDQGVLSGMAHKLGLYFHAYNNGKTLVLSKVPLPDYRADLDERHGSSQKEIWMPKEIECRVGNLLGGPGVVASGNDSSHQEPETSAINSAAVRLTKVSTLHLNNGGQFFNSGNGPIKKHLSIELKEKQDKLKHSNGAEAMISFREKLPAFKKKAEFLKVLEDNQVLVISGETGCGKTTQLPQFILEKEISSLRGANCNIICTQPRRISAISVATRVSCERGEVLGESVGYQVRLESKRSPRTRLLFCTTGVLLRQLVDDPHLSKVTHLLIDEIHERGMNEDFLLVILRDLLPKRPDLRLVLMSATINAELFSKYFTNAPILTIPGFAFPVDVYFLEDVLENTGYEIRDPGNSRRLPQYKDPLSDMMQRVDVSSVYENYSEATRTSLMRWSGTQLDLDLVEAKIEYISEYEACGAILIFLTGWDEISKLFERLKANEMLGNENRFRIFPLHGSMPTINQREIFDRPPSGVRKIILATNIAESSITIDDVVYVVDCGKAKETSYDALNNIACLTPSWISKASAHQRRGRAGRVQEGICYRLYPKLVHDGMVDFQPPEILRTPLQGLCLQVKSLRLGSVSAFLSNALQPPDPLSIQNAIDLLETIGALRDDEQLTPLGRHLCTLPVDPNIGKLLLMGCIFLCLDPVLTIASSLAHRDPFVLPISHKEEADCAKRVFAGDSCSDHIAVHNAFKQWKAARRAGRENGFCWNNFLSAVTMQTMDDMRGQFLHLLSAIGFVDESKDFAVYNRYSDDLEIVCAVLCAGLYPNVVRCDRRRALYTKDVGKVDIHPSSVNAAVRRFPLPYLVYSEKVKTRSIYIRHSTNISDYALLLFGGRLLPGKSGGGIEMLGGYLHFSASANVVGLIKKLRGELDKLLDTKIEEPGLDVTEGGKRVVDAVVELLHNQHVTWH